MACAIQGTLNGAAQLYFTDVAASDQSTKCSSSGVQQLQKSKWWNDSTENRSSRPRPLDARWDYFRSQELLCLLAPENEGIADAGSVVV